MKFEPSYQIIPSASTDGAEPADRFSDDFAVLLAATAMCALLAAAVPMPSEAARSDEKKLRRAGVQDLQQRGQPGLVDDDQAVGRLR